MPIKHAFTSPITDGGDPDLVGPDEWNANHLWWEQIIDEDGSTLTNFTAGAGTWSSDGTIIKQTNTAASHHHAHYNVATFDPGIGAVLFELETRIVAEHGGGDHSAGLIIGYGGSTGNGLSVMINRNDQTIQIERYGALVLHAPAFTNAASTWYKLRVLFVGMWLRIWVDGTLIVNLMIGEGFASATAGRVGLGTYAASADFRNIKVWTLSIALPA